ncbi:hypothetical protein SDC9_68204 [bioreactor metagenome]|uniref:Copper amine oxidase-like N-terminal domain-containing protein n=1 Tax=bioreactor metagenome TaxID=1076179 RepID=A0A644Y077_9ZZZZ
MKKRLLTAMLALCMVLTMLPTATFAAGNIATPSKTTFVINGQTVNVPEAYDVNNGNNCLQLRGIAVLLKGTAAQFNVSWDGTYAVIETGKPYTGTANPAALAETTNVRKSTTKFSIDGKVTSFDYAYYIDGNTNYLNLREVGAKLSGTASQFNLYWDGAASQAVIEPGKPYTGVAPTAAAAQNYLEEDVTWIGTTAEYQKTLSAFFDSGLRVMPVGTIAEDGAFKTGKYGLVDSSGRWAAQPVYDKIQAEYWTGDSSWGTGIPGYNKPVEQIFVDGYVQATRNGKMGLLDSTGKEVIPCEYKAVGLPVEGVSRLIQEINGKSYIGYWNLELGVEIVKPGKYIADYSSSAAGTAIDYGFYYKPASDTRMVCKFDFNGGYALVLTGKSERIAQNAFTDHGGGANDIRWDGEIFDTKYVTVEYAQMIDKNGKEILPQAYPVLSASLESGTYPQNGPYMVYQAVSTNRIMVESDQGGGWKGFDKHLEEGVIGASGIIIPAKYWGGFWANGGPGMWRFLPNPYGASTALFVDEGIIVTTYADYTQSELSGKGITGYQKIIDFKGKEISATIPQGTPAKEVDPDGNLWKIEIGTGIISGVQVKQTGYDWRVKCLVDVKTGRRLTDDQFALKSQGRGLFVTSYGDYFGPDGKIVFPRAETTTAVKNNPNASEQTVGYDLTLLVRDGKVGYVNASRLAVNGKLPTTPRVKPAPPPMPDWTKFLEKPPEPVVIPEGVDVIADGSYYLQIFGKYLVPVETDFNEYSVQLSATKPEYPFVVKLVSYDAERGPAYDITYNSGATWNASKDGDAFKFGKGGVDATTPKWKISQYSTFCTIRKYANQALAVNASGAKSADGTKVTLWTYKGSAPDHAKITFVKAD